MAISQTEFIKATSAEVVGSRLIVGAGPSRRFVGSIEEGVFSLNDAGKEIAEVIEAGGNVDHAIFGKPDEEVEAEAEAEAPKATKRKPAATA